MTTLIQKSQIRYLRQRQNTLLLYCDFLKNRKLNDSKVLSNSNKTILTIKELNQFFKSC